MQISEKRKVKSEKWSKVVRVVKVVVKSDAFRALNCLIVELFDCWLNTDKLIQAYSPQKTRVGINYPTLAGWG